MFHRSIAFCLIALLASIARAGETSEPAAIPLWPNATPAQNEEIVNRGKNTIDRSVRKVTFATLSVYLPEADKNTGAAVVICPGGGYGGLAIDKEGHAVARFLTSQGIAGIVLKYRMPRADEMGPNDLPLPLQDAQRAIRTVRSRAAEWKIDPKRIGIMGFSAGGHLASTAGTHFDAGEDAAADPIARLSCRPDFLILIYPVITMKPPIAHGGSRTNLLGKEPSDKLVEKYCNELQVTAQTPPAFLVHAKDDPVKFENSELFHAAMTKAKIPCELLAFETGGHGFGLGVRGGEPATWPARAVQWLRSQGLLTSSK